MKITMLGCGASMGVPAVGLGWGACDPTDPRNRRRRVSLLVEARGKTILIDMSPDLHEQLVDANVTRLDAVVMTHAHADHLHGIDDVRGINRAMRAPIPLYADAGTIGEIERRFAYTLEPPPQDGFFYAPCLKPIPIDGPFTAAGLPFVPFAQHHGFSTTLGFRIGAFGYSTDVVELDDAAFAALAGIELWMVDCLRYEPHPTHSHLAKTLAWIDRLKPKRAILTHLDRPLDYRELAAQLPPGVEPGYDGLAVEVPDP
jgi:phosphoribosyl 1,2-cyclic phosphate phosphodiesterase